MGIGMEIRQLMTIQQPKESVYLLILDLILYHTKHLTIWLNVLVNPLVLLFRCLIFAHMI